MGGAALSRRLTPLPRIAERDARYNRKVDKWRSLLSIVFTAAIAVSSSTLVSAQPVWQTGTLQAVEKKVESTPRTYLWDVVVTSTDVITYRLHIRIDHRIFVADYTPEIQPSSLPVSWEMGRPLQLRVQKDLLIIKTSYGEITTYIRDRS